MAAEGDKPTSMISFSFGKRKETVKLKVSSIAETVEANETKDKDFIVGVEGEKIESTIPKEEEKPLVIPLIKTNVWKRDSTEESNELQKSRKRLKQELEPSEDTGKSLLDSEAVKEILKETAEYSENWKNGGNEYANLSIPLLMQNKVPDGFETDDKLDVSIRPDEAQDADYDEVPIEQYGLAMLRGMGWRPGEGIGSKMKKVTQPVQAVLRPKGQGLGADKGPIMKKKNQKGPADTVESPLEFKKGAGVIVTGGPHKNLYGKIEGVNEDDCRVVVKLAISGQTATLSQHNVQLVSNSNYKKHSKDISKFSKGHDVLAKKEREKNEKEDRDRNKGEKNDKDRTKDNESRNDEHHHIGSSKSGRGSSQDGRDRKSEKPGREREDRYKSSGSDRHKEDRQKYDRGRRREEKHRLSEKDKRKDREDRESDRDRNGKYEDQEDGESHKHKKNDSREASPQRETQWLQPDLRVRLIDSTFKKGQYYNAKVKVIDVLAKFVCTCKTEDGKLLDEIHQSMLETVIPRTEPGYVMIVRGKKKGQVGTIIKRDKVNCQATVQLLRDKEKIKLYDYNDICEYVGDIDLMEDY